MSYAFQEWKDKRAASGLTADQYQLALNKTDFDAADPAKLEYLMGIYQQTSQLLHFELHSCNCVARLIGLHSNILLAYFSCACVVGNQDFQACHKKITFNSAFS